MFENVRCAVVPVAGLGTRLLPLTRGIPKELLPLGRTPVLQHVIDELQQVAVDTSVLVTSERKAAIKEYFEATRDNHNAVRFVNQSQQKGLGHAVLCAREAVAEQPFYIALGDAVIKRNLSAESLCERMRRLCILENADAAIAFHEVPVDRVSRYGVAKPEAGFTATDEFFRLAGLVEKPPQALAPSRYAIAARYLCKPDLFRYLENTAPGAGGEIQLTDALQAWLKDGATILGVPLTADEKRYDIGNFESYYTAVLEYALRDDEFGASLGKSLGASLAAQYGMAK